MSNTRINAAREILGGMQEAVNHKYATGGEPSQRVLDMIEERKAEIRHMEREHEAQHAGQHCRCNAHEHGGDCMCFEDV